MTYSKKAISLSQKQAIENLIAVIGSDYFKAYEVYPVGSRITSDMMNVDSIGGWRDGTTESYDVGYLADTVIALLNAVESKGTLNEAFVQLTPSEEKIRAMEFEERLYEELDEDDPSLRLTFGISREGRHDSGEYSFRVVNLGFKKSYFESEGLDFKDAKKRLATWYREITRNLKKILPYPVQNRSP